LESAFPSAYDAAVRRTIFGTVLLLFIAGVMPHAQTASKPEDGFISPRKYTNAFFGFSLPLPQDAQLQPLAQEAVPGDPSRHALFAANSTRKGYPVIAIIADEIIGSGNAEPKKAVLGLGARSVDVLHIGGKEFSRGEWRADEIYRVVYATAVNGYLLYVSAFSYDKKVLHECERSIQALAFFDPAKAQEQAGPDARPYQGPPLR